MTAQSKSTQPTFDLKETLTENRLHGLWRLMKGYRLTFLIAIICLGFAISGRTATMLLLRYFIDDYLGQGVETFSLPVIASGFIGLALVQGVFTFLAGRLAAHAAESIIRRLRNYLLDHIQRLSFTYHDQTQTGELIQRVTSDIDAIRRFFADQSMMSGRILFLFFINLAALLWLNWQLALVSVIVVPINLVVSIFFFGKVSKAYEAYQDQEAVLNSMLQENLNGVRVVKAFARQAYENDKFDVINAEKCRRGRYLILMHSLFWPISDVLCGLQMVVGFFVGSLMTMSGTITIGTYMAYAGMVLMIIWPMRILGRLVVETSRAMTSFERISEIVREEREPLFEDGVPLVEVSAQSTNGHQNGKTGPSVSTVIQGDAVRGDAVRGELIFEQVNFSYENSDPAKESPSVLHDISFRCEVGQSVALLGATGSGKTSLINLLPRFYDYTEGHIWLDGCELSTYDRYKLRQEIGIVEQEPFLFSTTIRENISYGARRPVTQDEIEAAARAAAIHEVIITKFPEGYDTLVGEKGVTLSGGQKQRIAIARTLLKNPQILILDASTSAVDTETEALIRQALRELMKNRTTFIIAHRIQSVMDADLILVMDKGRIVQRGTHASLIAESGIYQQVYAMQTRMEQEFEAEIKEAMQT